MDNLRDIKPKTGMPEMNWVGPYQIQGELGRGFSSVVYLAADPKRGRAVALKLLTFPNALSPDLRVDLTERFRREARAVAGLTHPHIVAVYDAGQSSEGQPYLVLERLRGQSLRERLRSAARLSVQEALPIALRVAEALEYAHGRGIVHRDVKPDNIFLCLTDSGNGAALPKLMDFGISRTLTDQEMTMDGLVVGSPAYMAPEQISGEPVDARTDVFSLAVTLAEMLTGSKPFEADTVPAVMRQILHSAPKLNGLDNPRLERVLRKAMANRPGQRYASAGEFAQALRRVLPQDAPAASVATQFAQALPASPPVRPGWRTAVPLRRGLWVGAAALTGIALGLGAVRLWPAPPLRTAAAAVRSIPSYQVRTAIAMPSEAAKPPTPRRAAPPRPAMLSARLPYAEAAPKSAVASHSFVPSQPVVPAPRPVPPRTPQVLPQTASVRHLPHLLPSAPPAPVVIHLASAEIPPPVVRVSASHQEITRQEITRQKIAPQQNPTRAEAQSVLVPEVMPDSPPRLLSRTAPSVPFGLTPSGEQVTLHLHINKFGEVTDAEVLESSGSDDLDNAALDAAGDWTYAPAIRGGRPVRGETDAQVTFPAR